MRSTFPLSLGGHDREGPRGRFAGGKVVEVRAESGADAVREEMATDDGASYLGEVALVDGDSRVRKTGIVFFDTLFDENAACHIAWGQGIKGALDGGEEMSDEELAAHGTTTRSSTRTSWSAARGCRCSASSTEAPRCRSSTTTPGSCPDARRDVMAALGRRVA